MSLGAIESVTPECPNPTRMPADCRCVRCKMYLAVHVLKLEARRQASLGASIEELVFMATELPTGLCVIAEPMGIAGPVVGEAMQTLCGTPEPGWIRYVIVLDGGVWMATGTISLRERVQA